MNLITKSKTGYLEANSQKLYPRRQLCKVQFKTNSLVEQNRTSKTIEIINDKSSKIETITSCSMSSSDESDDSQRLFEQIQNETKGKQADNIYKSPNESN